MRWDSTAWIIMTFSSPCGLSLARKPAHLSFILAAAAAMAFYPCHADDDPGSVFPQPAYRAEQFVDFIGLNASPFDKYLDSGPYKGAGTKFPPELFFDLGVRHYRCGLKYELTLPDAAERVKAAYAKYGAKPMFLISPGKSGSPSEVVQLLKDYGGSEVVGELEGPNEVNNKFPPQELNLKYGGKVDEAAGAAYMVDYNRALKADPATKDIPFIAYTAIFTDYRLARPCDAFDCSNMHSYQGYNVPSASLLPNFISANHLLPEGGVIKPFVPTECGYNIEEDKSNHLTGNGSPHAQAINIPMLWGEYFRHGFIRRAYLFALTNTDGYGLLESDQATKRPSYYALQSLIAALKDATWNSSTRKWEGGQFIPKALLYTVEGAPLTLKSVTLQKANGEYSILMWNELPNWDSAAKRDLDNPAANVTLQFQTPVEGPAQVLRQDESGAFKPAEQVTLDHGSMPVSVPSSLIIIRIKPGAGIETTLPAAPEQLTGNATENSVNLSWSAPSHGPSPAGYFVFRNGWCIASTDKTSVEDKTPWIRPGLGYTYAVQAYDASGNMSDRVTQVVQTPAKYPDYIITDLGLENPAAQPGDKVRLRAKIKNVGDGASPVGTPLSVTFHMDGTVISWGGTENLAPGEEKEIVGEGGPNPTPSWTATSGAHLLEGHIDDIDRVPEEKDKANNVQDKTIVIGHDFKGELMGASEEAPWKVDLTAEGTEDWVHWGLNDAKAVNRKARVKEISDVTISGAGFASWTGGFAVRSLWSDGDPAPASSETNSSLWLNGVGGTYSFTAPADASERTLKVYAGGLNGVSCSLTATLSDGSASPYVSKTWTGNSGQGNWTPVPGDFAVVYTIHYHAASAGQSLKIDFKLENEPNRFLGQARLSAATLSLQSTK